jgi:hypothetical protein
MITLSKKLPKFNTNPTRLIHVGGLLLSLNIKVIKK